MVFSSIPFLFYFFPIVMILYYAVPFRAKNLLLLVASLIFYAWGEPIYIVLMIFSSIVDYTNGRLIEKFEGSRNKQKAVMIASICINVGLLGFFKYADFLVGNVNALLGTSIKTAGLPLPIGISFYTFQTMSYSVDVYRGDVKAERSFLNFMCYVSMFPQLIAGPIVRYQTVAEELKERTINFDSFCEGFKIFTIGLGKKVLIANNIGMLWAELSSSAVMPASLAWLGIVAFAFQIFFDFSGYSSMAIGLGRMFGFSYPENFNYPYIAKNITDFWRRWHMSLSGWFKDYVYIPLGGSRCSKILNIRNLLIVWMVTGFWHGANWNFIIWGLYFGLILICEKSFMLKALEKMPSIVKHAYALFLILIGWAIFAFDDMGMLVSFFGSLFGANGGSAPEFWFYLKNYAMVIVMAVIFSMPTVKILKSKAQENGSVVLLTSLEIIEGIALLAIFFVSTMYLVDASFNPFLYFRF